MFAAHPARELHSTVRERGFRLGSEDGRELRPFPSIDFDGLRSDPEIISGLKSAVGLADVYSRNLTDLAYASAATLSVVRETGS